jgi:hypothetical protein
MGSINFLKRRRIAEASLCDPFAFAAGKGFHRHVRVCIDMIALCRKESFDARGPTVHSGASLLRHPMMYPPRLIWSRMR